MNGGIVYLNLNDSFHRILQKFFHREHQYLGFYFESSVSGSNKIQVYLIDTIACVTPVWCPNGISLLDLQESGIVQDIQMKKLKLSSIEHCRFRTSILTSIAGLPKNISAEKYIQMCFDDHDELCAFDILKRILNSTFSTSLDSIENFLERYSEPHDLFHHSQFTFAENELIKKIKLFTSQLMHEIVYKLDTQNRFLEKILLKLDECSPNKVGKSIKDTLVILSREVSHLINNVENQMPSTCSTIKGLLKEIGEEIGEKLCTPDVSSSGHLDISSIEKNICDLTKEQIESYITMLDDDQYVSEEYEPLRLQLVVALSKYI